jgi:hypothetical protein
MLAAIEPALGKDFNGWQHVAAIKAWKAMIDAAMLEQKS